MKRYRVFGLCRSGNHAIIGWLINKFEGKVVHWNNMLFNTNRNIFTQSELPRTYRGNKGDTECMILSFEDYDLQNYFKNLERELPQEEYANIFIVRDPFNLFASRNKKAEQINHKRLQVNKECVRIWKVMVKEAYNETKFTKNKIVINYNFWVTDSDYRAQVSDKLGLPTDADNINVMSKDGNGSSFDNFKYKANPQDMKVLERWKHFENDKNYVNIFKDKELVKLSDKYFNMRGLYE